MDAFLSYDVVLDFSRLRQIHIFKAMRFLPTKSAREYKRVEENVERVE